MRRVLEIRADSPDIVHDSVAGHAKNAILAGHGLIDHPVRPEVAWDTKDLEKTVGLCVIGAANVAARYHGEKPSAVYDVATSTTSGLWYRRGVCVNLRMTNAV